jgi:hypothetical protein
MAHDDRKNKSIRSSIRVILFVAVVITTNFNGVSSFVPSQHQSAFWQKQLRTTSVHASPPDFLDSVSKSFPTDLQTSAHNLLADATKLIESVSNIKLNLNSLTTNLMTVDSITAGVIQSTNRMIETISLDSYDTVKSDISTLWSYLVTTAFLLNPWHTAAILVFSLGAWLQLAVLQSPIDFTKGETPFPPGADTYSPERANAFYSERRGLVLKRIIQLAFMTSGFTTGILFDWLVLGKLLGDEEYSALKRNEPRRAKVALALAESLGPTFIKLGQALSIRTDLIPEAYALELRALQDQVTPFDSAEAREILMQQFDVSDLSLIFSELTEEPVASASVGQVYKGMLAVNGKEVAVKVQRPGILAEIALDLFILRQFTPIQTRLQNAANGIGTSKEDLDLAVGLVDEWGRGFVAETDYRLEAQNTMDFQAAMEKRKLDAVCAPTVVPELVRDKVLVTQWVQGTRLDLDASPDVPRLCGVAINVR